ncbi:glycoside hydrolase family 48 protein [Actinoplanes derwentensis]|uniref:Cellulose binding domain-containing protein n=1 Tax=Actinoplanes derwentensis TaxID=113562 RepID=A0A1H2A4Y9_9ACTN|nr:glycoside hydrolase family 48 protein [Actinoplanes derwentensis]GID83377.1 cellulose 1,4-beta-cellobiosidase [Actinoplanes derwentensis]SDT40959.1 Cellulose binding domain-containing protein [Actinoplanes derwentensis]
MSPFRQRLRRRLAVSGVAVLGAGAVLAAGAPAYAAAGCTVVYKVQSQWTGGFTGDIQIKNTGDPLSTWKLQFDFPDANQKAGQGWSGVYSQSGTRVTVDNAAWNGALATGATVGTGFNGTFTTANPVPTVFTLNGTTCNQTANAPTVAISSPAANTRYTAPASIPIAATATAATGQTISRVEFYHDGLLLGSDTTAPYAYTWDGVPAQSAAYHLQAVAFDNAGTRSSTADVPVFVDASTTPAIVADATSLAISPGASGAFRVSLSKAPTANVTVAVARSAGSTAVTVTPASLTFTPSNWGTGQAVTVAASTAAAIGATATISATSSGYTAAQLGVTVADQGSVDARFTQLYNDLKSPANGYFSPEGVPYHSIETLIDEAPDHGHETTSEAFSYWLWLEASQARISGSWTAFNSAWATMEKYIIPSHADQPTNANYNPAKPATYAAEHPLPSQYPSQLDTSVSVGTDPLAAELKTAYGTDDIYGMHWLLDVDNTYGFGHCGDGTTRVAYINTFQRGPQESTWETVPQPACDTFAHGGPNGYLDLFTKDASYAKQWKYTNAPDADARVVQVAYWALQWATEQGKASQVASAVTNAAKMGDYLRYSFYDKYFKQPGCGSTSCPAGTGKNASSNLMSWYYAWGGAYDTSAGWAWRIGSSTSHFGYQNPMAAYILSNVTAFNPKSPTAKADWQTSLDRQLEFYQWLQSSEGAIAGGATNSWNGDYSARPTNVPQFYGLSYVEAPVYEDPPSNRWFGMQTWSLERLAELYYVTGNAKAKAVLDKWVPWALANTTIGTTTFAIPSDLAWSGAPATWNPSSPAANTNLHVTVSNHSQDLGVAGSFAKLLTFYAAKSGNAQAKTAAKGLLDAIWAFKDGKGVSSTETRADYNRFDDVYNASTGQGLYIPPGWTGEMPNGDVIKPGVSFLDIRSFYRSDPDFPKVQAYLNGGAAPTFNYHRFWAQVDVATGYAEYARLFPQG